MNQPSGVSRLLLRLPASLHRRLRHAADAVGVSVNEWCVRRLSFPVGRWESHAYASAVVTRAEELFGDGLDGVIVHGSWARGEATVGSDVDVLIVLRGSVPLTRALYREWDRVPLHADRRLVDAHFVHLPDGPPRAGIWCDAAIDGLLLFDRDGSVSQALTRVRRAIAAHLIVRRTVHGHPYWVEAA